VAFPCAGGADEQDSAMLSHEAGGGQQGPVLAVAGANVTVFDDSPLQLE
jgi:hypothetical protein